jgi:hypothetical protein
MEKYYAFIKNNVVHQVAVFAEQNEELADHIAQEQGYDDAIWVGENKPYMWASYDGATFTIPTDEYLIANGLMDKPTEDN